MYMDTNSQETEEIIIEIRSDKPPYTTTSTVGYAPFIMYGELFAVTLCPSKLIFEPERWCVTHVDTGAAVPGSHAASRRVARARGQSTMQAAGEARVLASVKAAKDLIAGK